MGTRRRITLLDMGEGTTPMAGKSLDKFFNADSHNLIYVYDFLAMWTFFVELMEIGEAVPAMGYPNLVFAQGEVPEEAPEKEFSSEESAEDFNDDDQEEGLLDYDDADFY